MTKLTRTAVLAGGLSALVLLVTGCSDRSPIGPDTPRSTFEVSLSELPAGLSAARVVSSAMASAPSSVAYVSVSPGTFSGGANITMRHLATGLALTAALVDGGLDPMPVPAAAGDTLEFVVTDAAGATLHRALASVPARRPPRVVRTIPPRGKTDVPVNGTIIVVFSEPVDGTSLTAASIRLLRGTTSVAGTVRFLDATLDATHVSAEFVPTVPLVALTQFQVIVTRNVRDLSGEALSAADTTMFTSGEASTGPPASIRLSPDSMLYIVAGATYQMTAMVQDAAGNVLTDQQLTWSSTGDPSGPPLTVSPTGLLTPLGEGWYRVTASVAGLNKALTVNVSAGPPASVTVSPTPSTVAAGDTIILATVVRDAAGRVSDRPSVTWTSSAPAIATIASYDANAVGVAFGTVTGVSPGSVTITATSGAVSATAAITVVPTRPPASVTVTPASMTLIVQATAQLSATLRDAAGKVITGQPITWTSDNAAVARVDANGLVTAVSQGPAAVTATSGVVSGTAAITVTTLTFASVSAGSDHTCGLTTSGGAYCWGINYQGNLGNGSIESSLVPAPVIGGLTFTALDVGSRVTCGLTTSGAAYCWGDNLLGQLGIGSSGPGSFRSAPVAVTGGLNFTAVSVGSGHTCGVTTSGAAYCWGLNYRGQLGVGTTTGPETCTFSAYACSTVPVQVVATSGLTFTTVSAGSDRTCGVTTGGAAYCWGSGGGLGDGSVSSSSLPVAVTGGLTFTAVTTGGSSACGLTSSGGAYCWGSGILGDGSTNSSLVPVAVTGGLTFTALSVASNHKCGVATGGAAYCWGDGGALGDGSTNFSLVPVAVTGGLTFTRVTAGLGYTCGVTTSRAAYCWGRNEYGQLGNGSSTTSLVPVKVAGQP